MQAHLRICEPGVTSVNHSGNDDCHVTNIQVDLVTVIHGIYAFEVTIRVHAG